jgi:hypothetical protein
MRQQIMKRNVDKEKHRKAEAAKHEIIAKRAR